MKYNVISATCKGRSKGHIYQDHLRVFESETCLLAVVADGLGSVVSSSRGSELICQVISEFASNIDWRIRRTRQTLWSAVQMLTQKLCCQTIHDCPKVVPLHYESE